MVDEPIDVEFKHQWIEEGPHMLSIMEWQIVPGMTKQLKIMIDNTQLDLYKGIDLFVASEYREFDKFLSDAAVRDLLNDTTVQKLSVDYDGVVRVEQGDTEFCFLTTAYLEWASDPYRTVYVG